ncbi:response regulator transcription factor [Dyadobacter sediminis]|uniref:Helix-turn-helix transcriptional regulator n=1 Tax=Dyadobacter sediminis TaxID=1493691 RepID=A0A5R9K8A2_9BACT|nr:LuxR C-terminal-related transcriptional regulator [Dyadobacter sediminis]TLU90294.1 helix-turn-helix transcriptional regulator [Dyadobacter sediminis]
MTKFFDLCSFRKVWKSDILSSEINFFDDLIRTSPLLEETLRLRKASVAVIDLHSMRYLCTIGDLKLIIGWDHDIFLKEGVAFFLSKLESSDYRGLEKMSKVMTDYVVTLSHDKIANFKSYFDFRMIRPDGQMVRILQEGVILKRDPTGNISLLLAMISNISYLKRNNRQHLRLTDGNDNLIYEVDNESGLLRKLDNLTKRELEIARMIGEKLTSEEIGERLFLSIHTINTHRQNIVRKLNMADMMEINNFLLAYQII